MPESSSDAAIPQDLIEVGRVASAHGIRGWLNIQPHSPQAQALQNAPVWWLKAPNSPLESGAFSRPVQWQVQVFRQQGDHCVAQLLGLANRTAAEQLRGYTVWVPRAAFPDAQADEYYWIDLIGCDFYAQSDSGESVLMGQIDQIFDNSAHAVLQVACGAYDDAGDFQPAHDARGRLRHVLVPFVAAHVQQVDLPNRKLISNWPLDF